MIGVRPLVATTGDRRVDAAGSMPTVSARLMAEVDRIATEEFGIELLQMMELAGSHLAEVVRLELGGDLRGRRVVVAAGPGNNGGGGLAAARHLTDRGASVRVILAQPVGHMRPAARHQLSTLLEMAVECCVAVYDVADAELDEELASADAVVDAILGYGAVGAPRDGARWLIDRIGRSAAPVISLDVPSGVDPDRGVVDGAAIQATATLTLALPKPGLLLADGVARTGRLYLGDIGLPAAVFRRLGVDVGDPFASGPLVRLEVGS